MMCYSRHIFLIYFLFFALVRLQPRSRAGGLVRRLLSRDSRVLPVVSSKTLLIPAPIAVLIVSFLLLTKTELLRAKPFKSDWAFPSAGARCSCLFLIRIPNTSVLLDIN